MTEEDNFLDVAIAFGCLLGLTSWISYEVGQHNVMQDRTYCAATLADGRQLTTHHLGPLGATKCTYAPVYGLKKTRRI